MKKEGERRKEKKRKKRVEDCERVETIVVNVLDVFVARDTHHGSSHG